MKHIQKIIALLAILGIINIGYSENLGVDEINVIDANTISVILSDNPNLEQGEVEGEITILNDISIRGAVISETLENAIELMLEDPITPNTKYSLLTISGADGSIDFETNADVEGFTASNIDVSESQDIDMIEILDDRTIIISYTQEINSNAYEYKLLAESDIISIQKPDYFTPELVISIQPPLMSHKDYILMFIDMQDAAGNYLEFDTGIYDFTTEEIAQIEEQVEDSELGEVSLEDEELSLEDEELSQDILVDDGNTLTESGSLDSEEVMSLEAAPEDMSLEKDSQTSAELDTEEAASMVSQTPDTGAETWVLVLATLFINTFYYLSRRKKTLLAS